LPVQGSESRRAKQQQLELQFDKLERQIDLNLWELEGALRNQFLSGQVSQSETLVAGAETMPVSHRETLVAQSETVSRPHTNVDLKRNLKRSTLNGLESFLMREVRECLALRLSPKEVAAEMSYFGSDSHNGSLGMWKKLEKFYPDQFLTAVRQVKSEASTGKIFTKGIGADIIYQTLIEIGSESWPVAWKKAESRKPAWEKAESRKP
jgi:hypothetical protein